MLRGSTLTCVCVPVCPVRALTFESFDLETLLPPPATRFYARTPAVFILTLLVSLSARENVPQMFLTYQKYVRM